jgi:hypothetical protein
MEFRFRDFNSEYIIKVYVRYIKVVQAIAMA